MITALSKLVIKHAFTPTCYPLIHYSIWYTEQFSDKEYEVRFAAHKAVEMCARIKEGKTKLMTNYAVS